MKSLVTRGPVEVGTRRPYIVAQFDPQGRHVVCAGEPTGGCDWPATGGPAGRSLETIRANANTVAALFSIASFVEARGYPIEFAVLALPGLLEGCAGYALGRQDATDAEAVMLAALRIARDGYPVLPHRGGVRR